MTRRSSIPAVLILAFLGALVPSMSAAAVVYCDGMPATIVGTPGDDIIYGTSSSDVIAGLGGDDQLFAGPESDFWYDDVSANSVCGGPGKDRIFGSGGRDRLLGNADRDEIVGGPGYDILLGGPAGDFLDDDHRGGIDDLGYGTFLGGGDGPDRMICGEGLCKAVGGDGNDHIRAYNVGENTVIAGRGDDAVDTVDLNVGTFDDCGDPVPGGGYENCPYFPDQVDGGGGTDFLRHDADDHVGFETVVECPYDPDHPCSGTALP